MDFVEHAVQPLEDEDEGGADSLRRPVGDGQHLHDVAPQPSALHGQGVVGRQLQQGVSDLRQPGREMSINLSITFLTDQFVIWSIKCQNKVKKRLSQFLKAQADIFKLFVLIDQQSKTQIYLV